MRPFRGAPGFRSFTAVPPPTRRPLLCALIGLVGACQIVVAQSSGTPTLRAFDLLISEIMADPSPPVGLPEVEYLEIYNPTERPVRLGLVELIRGDASIALPDTNLPAGAYIAFAADPVDDDRFVHFADLPTLTNSGGRLGLIGPDDTLLDLVEYSPSWHASGLRDGGVSLERIDFEQPCHLDGANWSSSAARTGGTPGGPNAAAGTLPATDLRISRAELIDSATVRVSVNRAIVTPLAQTFVLDGAPAESLLPARGELRAYDFALETALTEGQLVRITLSPNAGSCVEGERAATDTVVVGLPLDPGPGDWAINEIMFDPLPGDGRYVELRNLSDGLLALSDVGMAVLDEAGAPAARVTSETDVLVVPGGFAVIADDAAALLARFPSLLPAAVAPSDLPTLADADCLELFTRASGLVLERVCYSARWHNRAYANTDGVALERIDVDAPGQDASNWTSASVSSGGGTPTEVNSQARRATQTAPRDGFSLTSERVSPDGDGYEDLLEVGFALPEPGLLLGFEVADVAGRIVYRSERDESLGVEGRWTWDGVGSDGEVVAPGTYVLRVSTYGAGVRVATRHFAFSVVERI